MPEQELEPDQAAFIAGHRLGLGVAARAAESMAAGYTMRAEQAATVGNSADASSSVAAALSALARTLRTWADKEPSDDQRSTD